MTWLRGAQGMNTRRRQLCEVHELWTLPAAGLALRGRTDSAPERWRHLEAGARLLTGARAYAGAAACQGGVPE